MKIVCSKLGCLNDAKGLAGGFCFAHGGYKVVRKRGERADYHKLYASKWWKRARKEFIIDNPMCKVCSDHGIVKLGNDVDHIKPHMGDESLFFSVENLQTLCKACHNRKTNLETKAKKERKRF